MYIGIDCGTQGTKVLIVDSQSKQIVATGYAKHHLLEDNQGGREQHPSWWLAALKQALQQALQQAKINPLQIKGIGVSGQQHGAVFLDENDQPLYNAKLWCDTSTTPQNQALTQQLGGENAIFERLGIMLQTGYTASKIAWFRQQYPELYQRIAKIMLPHDYLNYWLTGEFVSECGDASGTGYFDVHKRNWDFEVFQQIAPELDPQQVLPKLLDSQQKIGKLRPEVAQQLGLSSQVIVATGGGDNMLGAIGTGNIKNGVITMSLGTSGTIYSYCSQPLKLPPMIANFCSSNGGWLPLICVMNMTSNNNHLMKLLNIDLEQFQLLAQSAPIGAQGIKILPFFNGERVPPLPMAKASFHGLDSSNFKAENLCRAMLEASSFTLKYGFDLLQQAGLQAQQIRLIGGGAKSPLWRQMLADILQTEVICLKNEESAALGAALQAMWANGVADLEQLCADFIELDESRRALPSAENIPAYQQAYEEYLAILQSQYC